MPSDIAVYGLGVMGRNIALNLVDRGFRVSVCNRTAATTTAFVAAQPDGGALQATYSAAELTASLATPRVILLMAKAGSAVDAVIDSLLPHLARGDVIVDGGNSFFRDSQQRWEKLRAHGIHFLGMGISGGEQGARHGPSLMPGGDPQAWPIVRRLFRQIAARADDGEPCCRWVGEGGAGHYVKMVHNGIEYGDMQLIAEAWQLMRDGLDMSAPEIAATFAAWNDGVLSSYLISITADILTVTEADGSLRVDHIRDAAGQKGTGRWTAIDALHTGVPLTLISEAVFARALSAMKDERVSLAARLDRRPHASPHGDRGVLLDAIHDALYAAKIISYTQGFLQMRSAANEYGWELAYGEIAMLWRAGCIIRSRFLDDIHHAFERDSELPSLLFDDFFADAVRAADAGWRAALKLGISCGIPLPAMSSALSFYDGYRSAVLPANLLQAQRDYFGAHTYQRIDGKPGAHWHTHWSNDRTEDMVDD